MRAAKGLFQIRTACLPLTESARTQPRLSFGLSLPLAQLHPRNTVCVRKHAFNPNHASCTSARYRLR